MSYFHIKLEIHKVDISPSINRFVGVWQTQKERNLLQIWHHSTKKPKKNASNFFKQYHNWSATSINLIAFIFVTALDLN